MKLDRHQIALGMLVFLALLLLFSMSQQESADAFQRQEPHGDLYLPVILAQREPTPTPPPAPDVHAISCHQFPQGPSDVDWVRCAEGGVYEVQRHNVSFTMVACCGVGSDHYAVELDARLVEGEGDYRIGFDIVSLTSGGGYLIGVNPRDGTYSLVRVDGSDWKGGVFLIGWTQSPRIRRGTETNHLRVERNGDAIILSINGEQVATVEDGTYRESGLGWTLYARNYHQPNSVMHFDHIRHSVWE